MKLKIIVVILLIPLFWSVWQSSIVEVDTYQLPAHRIDLVNKLALALARDYSNVGTCTRLLQVK